MNNIKGKTILICGGLGEIAKHFISSHPENEFILVDSNIEENPDAYKFNINITSEKDVTRLSEQLKHKQVDNVLLTPAYNPKKDFEDLTYSELRRSIEVKPIGFSFLLKALIKRLKINSSTVLISSVHAHKASRGNLGYAMSNAAIESLTRGLAIEYKDKRFNSITLGGMLTENYKSDHQDDWEDKLKKGQLVSLKELVNVIAFLFSDDSSGINAQNIVVDGGVSAIRPSSSMWE